MNRNTTNLNSLKVVLVEQKQDGQMAGRAVGQIHLFKND